MQSKNKSLILNASLVALVAFFAMFVTSCSEEEVPLTTPTEELNEIGSFSKEIKISDDNGNYVILRISSAEEKIVNSYSVENYTFRALRQVDIDEMLSQENNIEVSADSENIEDFSFNEETMISVSEEVIEEHLSSEYVTYMLSISWKAPDEFSNRGFDWHAKSKTGHDYAYLKNDRCCWAIYWKCDVWNPNLITIAESQLKGKEYKNDIGEYDSDYIQLHIRYRQESHYTYYYHD